MEKKVIIGIGILGSIVIVFLFVFNVAWQENPTDENLTQPVEQVEILDSGAYQGKVSTMLDDFLENPDTSNSLDKIVANLQSLTVNRDVAQDHLTLFQAFDTWQRKPADQTSLAQVRDLLLRFAANQNWSETKIRTIVTSKLGFDS